MQPDGSLHTIDNNEELNEIATRYFEKSPYASQINKHTGQAMEIIPALHHLWDLVFIDADKSNYLNYYGMVIDNVRPGGLILTDNVLWSGKVLSAQVPDNDKDTLAIKKFNETLAKDPRVEKILLPIRDGIFCTIKK